MQKLLVITGPTALGKTQLAVQYAARHGGEIISADSRQVYRGMDIGTGKDLTEFEIGEQIIPHHLIDICEAGTQYNLFRFQRDFHAALKKISSSNQLPILCGGTGLYVQIALQKEALVEVPLNEELRAELDLKTQNERVKLLQDLNPNLHNQTDSLDSERTIRAIELAQFQLDHPETKAEYPPLDVCLVAIRAERELLRERIKQRLDLRLKEGMIEEVEHLMNRGISLEQLNYYGLEYKYIGQYLHQQLTYEEMYLTLLKGIRGFAKRQMTWFRRMEKQGHLIRWLDLEQDLEAKMENIEKWMNEKL